MVVESRQETPLPRHLFTFLLPSSVSQAPKTPNAQTGHLDGLRGLASFIVLLCHTAYSSHDLSFGYGYAGEPGQEQKTYESWLRLPIIRLSYDGDAAVAIFFLISGFALSWKPLRLAREGAWDSFAKCLMASTVKRWLRLFLPVLASTGLICLGVQFGLYELTRGVSDNANLLTAFREPHPKPHANIFLMIWDWMCTNWKFWELFHWDRDDLSQYDIHLWTIPLELRASMGLFVTLLAVARMTSRMRVYVLVGLIFVASVKDSWAMMLFWGGALEAELTLARLSSASNSLGAEKSSAAESSRRTASDSFGRLFLWAASLFLMSQPFNGERTFMWSTLVSWVPSTFTESRRFYTCIGSLICFHLLNTSPAIAAFFRRPTMQFLGRISFSLYLVHAFLLHTVGYALFALVWSFTGVETMFMREVGFVIASLATLGVIIWVADVFTRAVDEPSVDFAKWVERRVLVID
nr:hypothetical protein CFP56_42232 [Quercus suber]